MKLTRRTLEYSEPSFRFEPIVFLQDNEATEALALYNSEPDEVVLDYLKQWDMEPTEAYLGPPWGTDDRVVPFGDRYILSVNDTLDYIGLCRVLTRDEQREQYPNDFDTE